MCSSDLAGRQRRLLPTRANGSPAFGLYQREAEAGVYQLFGLVVLGVVGEQIDQEQSTCAVVC